MDKTSKEIVDNIYHIESEQNKIFAYVAELESKRQISLKGGEI